MAKMDATRACVVCGVLFPRDGKRTLCSEKCRAERQLQYHRVDKRELQCAWCGAGFVATNRDKYCCSEHAGLAKLRRDAARKATPDVRARANELQKISRKPMTDLQRRRRNERRSLSGRGCRACEYSARARQRRAEVAPSLLWIDASYHMAHTEALAINAEIDRAARESLKAERDKQDSLRAERAKMRGLAASTLKLKEDPDKYAETLTYWRAKSLKRRTGQTMRADGTATTAVILGGKRCLYCDCILHEKNRTHDHMRPLSRGGVHSAANIAPCCHDCNSRKGAKGFEQWVATLAPKDSRRAVAYFEKRNGSIRQDGLVLAA